MGRMVCSNVSHDDIVIEFGEASGFNVNFVPVLNDGLA